MITWFLFKKPSPSGHGHRGQSDSSGRLSRPSLFLIILTLAGATGSNNAAAAATSPAPIGFYPLDEVNGAKDLSGNTYDGTAGSDVTYTEAHSDAGWKFPTSAYLAGGTTNSYFKFDNADLLSRMTGSFSLMAYIRLEDQDGGHPIFEDADYLSDFVVWNFPSGSTLYTVVYNNGVKNDFSRADTVTRYKWQKWVVTFNAETSTVTVSVDGVSTSTSASTAEMAFSILYLGRRLLPSSIDDKLKGKVSCLLIFEEALTTSQVYDAFTTYCDRPARPTPRLLGYYPLDDANGAKDLSGNGYDGVAGSAITYTAEDVNSNSRFATSAYFAGDGTESYVKLSNLELLSNLTTSVSFLAYVRLEGQVKSPVFEDSYSVFAAWNSPDETTLYGWISSQSPTSLEHAVKHYTWQKWAATFDSVAGYVLFLDDKVIPPTTGVSSIPWGDTFYIGHRKSGSYSLKGKVSCLLVYDQALWVNEIDESFATYCDRPVGDEPTTVLQCGFESGWCGFYEEDTTDTKFWFRRDGSTPSANTGPSTGHNSGYYAHPEPSGHGSVDQYWALWSGDLLETAGSLCVDFWYHMYGEQIRWFRVSGSPDGSSSS